MNRFVYAFPLLLAGCWPMIPGSWSEYDVPAETQIWGRLSYYEPLGGYWDDPDPSGSVAWGWFETPKIGLSWAEAEPGCRLLDLDAPAEELEFMDLGVTDASIRSELGTVNLDFDSASALFFAEIAGVGAGTTWTLDPVDADGGTFFVQKFIEMPPPLDFTGIPFAGDTPDTIDRGDFSLAWEPKEGVDLVTVQFQLVQGTSVFEVVACNADVKDRSVTVPMSVWTGLDDADAMYVYMASLKESASKIDGSTGASRMGAEWSRVGYVGFN